MKKALSILTLAMLLVSACSADVGLDAGGELLALLGVIVIVLLVRATDRRPVEPRPTDRRPPEDQG